jgi:phosphoribosylamine--glycine ligase
VSIVTDELVEHVMRKVVEPTLKGMAAAGAPFSGMLYAGLMLTEDGPRIIEYNCRFGDPETQAIVPRVADDLLMVIYAAATGHLPVKQVNLTKKKAACVVLASEGYPGRIKTGHEITGIGPDDYVSVVFHSGTRMSEGKTVTDGGRVLGVTGMGATIRAAVHNAYQRAEKIRFKGKTLRQDIAWHELNRTKNSPG